MSKNSPYDDEIESHEEEFISECNVSLPSDKDEYLSFVDINDIIEHVTKTLKEKYDNKLLTDINLSFSYQDSEGFASFENFYYSFPKKD